MLQHRGENQYIYKYIIYKYINKSSSNSYRSSLAATNDASYASIRLVNRTTRPFGSENTIVSSTSYMSTSLSTIYLCIYLSLPLYTFTFCVNAINWKKIIICFNSIIPVCIRYDLNFITLAELSNLGDWKCIQKEKKLLQHLHWGPSLTWWFWTSRSVKQNKTASANSALQVVVHWWSKSLSQTLTNNRKPQSHTMRSDDKWFISYSSQWLDWNNNQYNTIQEAMLSQRWPRDAPYSIWVLWKNLRVPGYAHS